MGIQHLVHIDRMNFHLDCFFCRGLVVGVTMESILSRLQTHWEETAQLVNKHWNSFLADHSLFFWDKNHGRILEKKSNLSASMAQPQGPGTPSHHSMRLLTDRGTRRQQTASQELLG